MNPLKACPHERDVLDLVLADRWPGRCDPDAVAHAAECEVCRDVVVIAMAMRADDARLEAAANAAAPLHHGVVPDATLVWWRAELRAHEDAARKAARPIAMVQGIGVGIGLVATVSLARVSWPWVRDVGRRYVTEFSTVAESALAAAAASSAAAVAAAPWLVLAAGVVLIATPVAIYVALGRE